MMYQNGSRRSFSVTPSEVLCSGMSIIHASTINSTINSEIKISLKSNNGVLLAGSFEIHFHTP